MLVRLLVAVSVLVGPFPPRVCTCAALGHHHEPPAPAERQDDSPRHVEADSHGHHHDCAAVSVRKVLTAIPVQVDDAPTFAVALSPTDDRTPLVIPLAPGRAAVVRTLSFLSVVVLRI